MPAKNALVVGVTGITGGNLAEHLEATGWTVYGLARRPPTDQPDLIPVRTDLLDAEATKAALAGIPVSHVFFTSWARQANEAENIRVNGAMFANVLAAVDGSPVLAHVALVTGLKHYLGPFEAFAKNPAETPFRETMPRVPYDNFYYTQEDILVATAAKRGFTWSVHRPHTLIGWALGNAMNMGVTLACYAAICKATGRPFAFPGSPEQWNGVSDVTDARQLAKHLAWAATSPAGANEAFNVVNGEVFRWRSLWPLVAQALMIDAAPYPGHATPLDEQMADAAPVWDRIVAEHGLQPFPLATLASWWHTDADLGRPLEAFTDMTKSRKAGFLDYQDSADSFRELFARLRREKIIPS